MFNIAVQQDNIFGEDTIARHCRSCGGKLTGRKIYYCSDACRDAYYRSQGYMLPDWPVISAEVIREHPVCQICNEAPSVEAHHKIPRKYGGTDDKSNLLATCHSCNMKEDALFRKQKDNPQLSLLLEPADWGTIDSFLGARLL